jgi:hypothetical protein
VPIAREDLFAYTNGRFLADEAHQFSRRYVRFDLDALCNTAATAGGHSRVTAIENLEGGFSKAFLMRKANGTEVIAKIPCRIAGPPSLVTAGEVGALEYGLLFSLGGLHGANIMQPSQKTHGHSCSSCPFLVGGSSQCYWCRIYHHGESCRGSSVSTLGQYD